MMKNKSSIFIFSVLLSMCSFCAFASQVPVWKDINGETIGILDGRRVVKKEGKEIVDLIWPGAFRTSPVALTVTSEFIYVLFDDKIEIGYFRAPYVLRESR